MENRETVSKALHKNFARYRGAVRRGRKELSSKTVHAIRVASRRLIAAVDLIDEALGSKRAGKASRALLKELKRLGRLRDVHIQVRIVRPFEASSQAVGRFLAQSRAEGKRLARENRRRLRTLDVDGLFKDVSRLESRLRKFQWAEGPAGPELPERPEQPEQDDAVFASFRTSIRQSVAGLAKLQAELDSAHPKTFHRFRLRCRQLRYQLEFLQPLFHIGKTELVRLRKYQDLLGRIQDLSVAIANLKKIRTLPPGIIQALKRRRQLRMKTFVLKSRALLEMCEQLASERRLTPGSQSSKQANL